MMMQRLLRPGLCLLILLATAQAANAGAILMHDYQLNNSLADSLGGPSLVNNGATLGATGLTFGQDQGPEVSNAIASSNYSIELRFDFDDLNGYRRIIDFTDRASDTGLYSLGLSTNFYNVATSPTNDFSVGTLANLVITRDGTTDQVNVYVNGAQVLTFVDSGLLAVFTGPNQIIHFFQDDFAVANESTSGFVDYIKIYEGALTAAEVRGLSAAPEPSTLATAALGLTLGLGAIYRRRTRS